MTFVAVVVALSWAEVALGARAGAERRIRALARSRNEPHGWKPGRDPWGSDVESTLAEIVVAKHLGIYWTPSTVTDKQDGDVGGYHVRHTRHDRGGLILHTGPDGDDPDGTFILVTGTAPTYRVAGAISPASDGMIEAHWNTTQLERPAFLVPQNRLEPALTVHRRIHPLAA